MEVPKIMPEANEITQVKKPERSEKNESKIEKEESISCFQPQLRTLQVEKKMTEDNQISQVKEPEISEKNESKIEKEESISCFQPPQGTLQRTERETAYELSYLALKDQLETIFNTTEKNIIVRPQPSTVVVASNKYQRGKNYLDYATLDTELRSIFAPGGKSKLVVHQDSSLRVEKKMTEDNQICQVKKPELSEKNESEIEKEESISCFQPQLRTLQVEKKMTEDNQISQVIEPELSEKNESKIKKEESISCFQPQQGTLQRTERETAYESSYVALKDQLHAIFNTAEKKILRPQRPTDVVASNKYQRGKNYLDYATLDTELRSIFAPGGKSNLVVHQDSSLRVDRAQSSRPC